PENPGRKAPERGSGAETGGTTLYLQGRALENEGTPLYLRGSALESQGTPPYLRGRGPYLETTGLYLSGRGVYLRIPARKLSRRRFAPLTKFQGDLVQAKNSQLLARPSLPSDRQAVESPGAYWEPYWGANRARGDRRASGPMWRGLSRRLRGSRASRGAGACLDAGQTVPHGVAVLLWSRQE